MATTSKRGVNRRKLTKTAAQLLQILKEQRGAEEELSSSLLSKSEALFRAANRVGESFSGSNFGYHGRLYYADFEPPPEPFSVEWGGVYGIPTGWATKTPEHVRQRIEELSAESFSAVGDQTKRLLKQAKSLQTEILIQLAPLHNTEDLKGERELLGRLEQFDWKDDAHGKHCAAAHRSFPNATRDSEAAMQGLILPSHSCYEAAAT